MYFFFYFINELYAFINYSKIMYTIKKLIIYLSSLISIVGCIGCGGGGGDSINDTPVSIEFNGDSLMYGPTLELNIPKYTKSTNPKWIVDDRGVGGLTMKSLDIGYKEPYINANPINYPRGPQTSFETVSHPNTIIVVQLGANDSYAQAYGQMNNGEFDTHLKSIVNTILSQNKIPVLVTIPQFATDGVFNIDTKNFSEINNASIRKLALEKSITLVEIDKIPFDIKDTIDGIHRTQEASNVIAQCIINSINMILLK